MSPRKGEQSNTQEFEVFLEFLKISRGFDFTGYKRTTLRRRVLKRMLQLKIEPFRDYMDYLEVHPDEFEILFNTILINVTTFFRDAETWEHITQETLPQLLATKAPDEPVRIWSAGCSSGQEAYTLAILLAEALGGEAYRQRVKIYATDIDEEALIQARQARYRAKDLEAIPERLRERYFEKIDEHFTFRQDFRRAVIFGRHDLMQDAPISRLDLLACRNTLMYFNAEIQARILARFHFALRDRGILVLGKAEMLLTRANLFTPLNLKQRIFMKVPKPGLRDRLLVMSQGGDTEFNTGLLGPMRLRDAAFDAVPIAQLVVDVQGTVVLINRTARDSFQLQPQDVGRPFHALELSYRPIELRSPLEQCYTSRQLQQFTNVERLLPDNQSQYLDIYLTPLEDDTYGLLGVSITLHNVTHHHQLQEEIEKNKQDLETAYEELQSTNEELETTNEELQSTVEELETTNEELQSTNEELETMNEELQSSNEEQLAINDELRERTDELNRSNAFMASILASLYTASVVIDRHFLILMWNQHASRLWGLRLDEVRGQSLLTLDIGLPFEAVKSPIRAILNGDSQQEEIVEEATNSRGKRFRCRIICTPLVDADNSIEGVILLMEDWDEHAL